MRKVNVGVSLCWALVVEVALWGVRSGPGWMLLFLVCAALSGYLLLRWERRFSPWVGSLWAGALAFSAPPLLYDSGVVHVLAPPLCLVTLLLAIHFTLVGPTRVESLTDSSLFSGAAVGEAVLAAREELGGGTTLSPSWRRGALLAVPMLTLFGALFLAADPAFGEALGHWFGDCPRWLMSFLRVLLWALMGLTLLVQAQRFARPGEGAEGRADDPVALAVALGSTCVLFVGFLLCQAEYLFAGRAPEGMSLAQYARHGFFELFLACVLVVVLVAWAHGSVFRHPDPGSARALSLVLVLLTFGLVASSAQRMALYVEFYGLTPLRLYVLMTLFGIVLTLALCAYALARWLPPAWLRCRLLLLGMGTLASVGCLNVEALVARVNLQRAEVDYDYLGTLSCDVLPALNLSDARQRAVAQRILLGAKNSGWREWNLSRARFQAHQLELVHVDQPQVGQLQAWNHGQGQE